MDKRDQQYTARFEKLESILEDMLISRSDGGSNSHGSPQLPPFQSIGDGIWPFTIRMSPFYLVQAIAIRLGELLYQWAKKADIRREVIAQTPHSILKVVSLAKLYEEKYTKPSKPSYNNNYSRNLNTNLYTTPNTYQKSNSLPAILPTPNQKPINPSNVKKISPAEMQLRREKGLVTLVRKNFLLHIGVLINSTCYYIWMSWMIQCKIWNPRIKPHYLALSSDNILQPRLANYLKLPIDPIPSSQVLVGNGRYPQG
ncbi:Transposon Ty3-G Gag-Pol polyprotein [Sesbania bispinosa]|nr:Transposon Ty3-G Gag-Pol polyprotein [Sesbania bispinosa]